MLLKVSATLFLISSGAVFQYDLTDGVIPSADQTADKMYEHITDFVYGGTVCLRIIRNLYIILVDVIVLSC